MNTISFPGLRFKNFSFLENAFSSAELHEAGFRNINSGVGSDHALREGEPVSSKPVPHLVHITWVQLTTVKSYHIKILDIYCIGIMINNHFVCFSFFLSFFLSFTVDLCLFVRPSFFLSFIFRYFFCSFFLSLSLSF